MEVLLEVNHGRKEQGDDHHDGAHDDPRPPAAQAVQLDKVNQRSPGPFESPGQEKRTNKSPDRLEGNTLLPHKSDHSDRGESVGDSFGDVEQAEGQETSVPGG